MNTNLAMGVQPLQIPDQAAGYQKALTMAALLGQQDLQKFQLAGAQRDQEKTQRIQQIAAESNGDYMTMRDRLAKAGYVNESLQLDKEINAGKKAGTDYQVSQADLSKKQSELAQGLSAGFTSLTPEQQQQAYPQFASEWKRMGLPNADKVPDQWNPQMLPHLQMIARQGIAPKDAAERADYAATGALPASPGATTMSAYTAQPPQDVVDPASGAEIRPMASQQPQGVPIAQNQAPTVDVTGKPAAYTPEDYRAEAARLRKFSTPGADKRAKDYEEEANRLDQRILQEQGLAQQKETAAENIRVREEGVKVRQQNQSQQNRSFENKLGDDFKSEEPVKRYRKVQPLISSMEEASKKNTAGSDLNMVYAIASIFDPDSVVREGEQIMVRNAGGLPSVVQSALGFVIGGQRLSPELRADILAEGRSRVGALKQGHDSLAGSYRRQATDQGLNPDNVVRTYDIKVPEPKGPTNPARRESDKNPPKTVKWDDLK